MLTALAFRNLCKLAGGIGAVVEADGLGTDMLAGATEAVFAAMGTAESLHEGPQAETMAALRTFRRSVERDWQAWAPHSSNPDSTLQDRAIADFNAYFATDAERLALPPARLAALRAEAATGPERADEDTARRLALALLDDAATRAPELYAPGLEREGSRAFFLAVVGGAFRSLLGSPAYRQRLILPMLDAVSAQGNRFAAKVETLATDVAAIPDAVVAKLMAALDRRGEAAGVERAAVMGLARRISTRITTFDEALAELHRAVEIAVEVREAGARGSNLDATVDAVMARLASLTAADRIEDAAAAADAAIADWERAEAARRAEADAALARLLEAGVRQDLLAGNPAAAAAKVERAARLGTADPAAAFTSVQARFTTWYQSGSTRGLRLDLEVALALADRLAAAAATPGQRAQAQHDRATALLALARHETAPARLIDAVAAFRAALVDRPRDTSPADWAKTMTNLGTALHALATRTGQVGPAQEAEVALRAALDVFGRDSHPAEWSALRHNLGGVLQWLGERESGADRLEAAVAAYREALAVRTQEANPLGWAMTMNNLGNALMTLARRDPGTGRLREAVAAYRASLTERTRERVPLDWAMTQHNLGAALQSLGAREGDTAALTEAAVALRAALTVRTEQDLPTDWAMTQNNLGNVLLTLAEQAPPGPLPEAVAALLGALRVYTRTGTTVVRAVAAANLGRALTVQATRSAAPETATEAAALLDDAVAQFRQTGATAYEAAVAPWLAEAQALRDRLAAP